MPHITRTLYLPYTQAQLFALVADIDQYHQFLPYCTGSYILREEGNAVEASLRIGYKQWGYTFASHNHNSPPNHIHMSLSKGPFSRLEGEWRFIPDTSGTRVELQLDVELTLGFIATALNTKLEEVTDKVMNAFIERAKVLYG